jgi:hypothetical protein
VPLNQQSMKSHGVVVAHSPDPRGFASEHERISVLEFARRLAALKDCDFGGMYEPSRHYPAHVYFVPTSTLVVQEAAALGIHGPDDLFGGVVPRPFVATKAISHPLVAPGAAALDGWNPDFSARVGDAVLDGYTVFNHEDACLAGSRLLAKGPIRLKPVRAAGGGGQCIARDAGELRSRLGTMDPLEVSHGLVIEEHLREVRTVSVGQVKVADLTASYFGFQRLTRNNRGQEVFGGSDLSIVRGGLDALLALDPAPEIRRAIGQSIGYDAAVRACFAGFFASRINYDIALGRDAAGRSRSGVLEQSWRVGGATGPEIAALEVFRRDPGRTRVHAAAFEVFGEGPEPPPHAIVHFRGIDPQVGPMTKYTVIEPDVDPR